MNDPYNGNGRKSPEDDLGRSIEKEVKETIGTVAAALQDAAREVSTSLRDNESVQRTVKDLGAAARDGVQGIQSAIAQAQKNAEKEKRRRKRRDYAKKANGALSEAGGLMLPAGILAACAFSAFEPGDPAGALILGFISLWFFAGAFGAFLKSRTLRRIATYQSVLGERSYCTLQELSELTGKSQGAFCLCRNPRGETVGPGERCPGTEFPERLLPFRPSGKRLLVGSSGPAFSPPPASDRGDQKSPPG